MPKTRTKQPAAAARAIPKAPSGIQGLDEVTDGGLPRGRPTLVCGSAGCGKTLLAMEFLVRGATEFGEPGVFMAFEETAEELAANVRSLGFDLPALEARKQLAIDQVFIDRSEIEETGEYDLQALFIRLGHAIDSVGAKRVVLDTLESLFSALANEAILRAELRRLFRWLKDKGVTAIITAERGDGALTRHGLEEYVSDCVIVLDHRVTAQLSTRRLRVVKYRGSGHGTNEYPFLIGDSGFSVIPITSVGLDYQASDELISTGIPRLDAMIGGPGCYRGSSVLISGTAGTGKTSIAAHVADAACRRQERCLYYSFEESRSQIIRNMRAIGLDLEPHVRRGILEFINRRPSHYGLEMHLASIHQRVREFEPNVVVLDPISNFLTAGTSEEVRAMLTRLLDFLKSREVTGVFLNLTRGDSAEEGTEVGLSSIMDVWILLRDIEHAGERTRGLYVLKSRGQPNSNQIREFLLTDHGIELQDVYLGSGAVLTGSARLAQSAEEAAAQLVRQQEIERRKRELDRKQQALEARIAAMRHDFEAERLEVDEVIRQEELREDKLVANRRSMAVSRKADGGSTGNGRAPRGGRK